MPEIIRILLVDDHTLLRNSLAAALLEFRDGYEVVAQASHGEEAVREFQSANPDVVLMDLVMPGMDGVAATYAILEKFPSAKILVLSGYDDDERVLSAIKAGAAGYLLKDATLAELLNAIQEVHNGNSWLQPSIAHRILKELRDPHTAPSAQDLLTKREMSVLELLAKGYTNREIAQKLVVNDRTVQTHVSKILIKLHLSNRTQAALYIQNQQRTSASLSEH